MWGHRASTEKQQHNQKYRKYTEKKQNTNITNIQSTLARFVHFRCHCVPCLFPYCFFSVVCLFLCRFLFLCCFHVVFTWTCVCFVVWVFCVFFYHDFSDSHPNAGLCIMTIWVSVWELDSESIWHREAFWMIVYKSSHGLSWELVWPILEALKATNFIYSIFGYHIFDPYPSSIGAYLQS